MDTITMPTIDSAILVRSARRGDRFQTSQGPLSFEELFDCKLAVLDKAYGEYAGGIEVTAKKSLAGNAGPSQKDEDAVAILTFVYRMKEAEAAAAAAAREKKARNQKIMEIIERKQGAELEGKSLDELKALLNE